jgi:hypothetical protein
MVVWIGVEERDMIGVLRLGRSPSAADDVGEGIAREELAGLA